MRFLNFAVVILVGTYAAPSFAAQPTLQLHDGRQAYVSFTRPARGQGQGRRVKIGASAAKPSAAGPIAHSGGASMPHHEGSPARAPGRRLPSAGAGGLEGAVADVAGDVQNENGPLLNLFDFTTQMEIDPDGVDNGYKATIWTTHAVDNQSGRKYTLSKVIGYHSTANTYHSIKRVYYTDAPVTVTFDEGRDGDYTTETTVAADHGVRMPMSKVAVPLGFGLGQAHAWAGFWRGGVDKEVQW